MLFCRSPYLLNTKWKHDTYVKHNNIVSADELSVTLSIRSNSRCFSSSYLFFTAKLVYVLRPSTKSFWFPPIFHAHGGCCGYLQPRFSLDVFLHPPSSVVCDLSDSPKIQRQEVEASMGLFVFTTQRLINMDLKGMSRGGLRELNRDWIKISSRSPQFDLFRMCLCLQHFRL